MLVIRRRAGESFLIGADIELQVLEISPTRVKIGIAAPAEYSILRKEVALTRAQNLNASEGPPIEAIVLLSRTLSGIRRSQNLDGSTK